MTKVNKTILSSPSVSDTASISNPGQLTMRSLQQLSVTNDALLYPAKVKGSSIVAEYDTGASDIYMSKSSAEALKLDYTNEQQDVELGDGSISKTVGSIDAVIEVGTVSSKERIYIMEDPSDNHPSAENVIVLGLSLIHI